jgi:hypothetical protein
LPAPAITGSSSIADDDTGAPRVSARCGLRLGRRRTVEQARHFLTLFAHLNVFNALARNERARLTSG